MGAFWVVVESWLLLRWRADEQTKEVRSVYENKLTAMTGELKQLVSASKLHIVNVRSQQTGQKQLDSLQKQVVDMNKLRVWLLLVVLSINDNDAPRSVSQVVSTHILNQRRQRQLLLATSYERVWGVIT